MQFLLPKSCFELFMVREFDDNGSTDWIITDFDEATIFYNRSVKEKGRDNVEFHKLGIMKDIHNKG